MTEWTAVDREKLLDLVYKGEDRRGVSYHVSPYDIPNAIRASYDRHLHQIEIEFRYVDEEPLITEVKSPIVTIATGKHSGRLYKIYFQVSALDVEVLNNSEEAGAILRNEMIRSLSKALRAISSTRKSYELTENLINERGVELFQGALQSE